MNVLSFLKATAPYAALIGIGLLVLVSDHAEYFFPVAGIGALFLLWLHSKTARRAINWYILYPIQRFFHRNRGPVQRLTGGIMAKWKKGLVADCLEDALFDAYTKGTLSKQEYKKYSVLIGKALGLDDLLPKKNHKSAIKNRVKKNCAEMHDTGPKHPVPGKPDETTGKTFGLEFLKRRRAA